MSDEIYHSICDPNEQSAGDMDYTELFYYPEIGQQEFRSCFILGQMIMTRSGEANSAGMIFGGWIFSQMDLAGASVAQKKTNGAVATIGVDDFVFLDKVYPGEVISVYCAFLDNGNSSVRYRLEAWAEDHKSKGTRRKVAAGQFTFVAIDRNGERRMVF